SSITPFHLPSLLSSPITTFYLSSCPISPFCFLPLFITHFYSFHLLLLSTTLLLFHFLISTLSLIILIHLSFYLLLLLNTVIFFFKNHKCVTKF
ncbi:hypothetical protein C1646_707974, partial [Rhizophagus diaphanus]